MHLLQCLLGEWIFDREIAGQARMSGAASFVLIAPGTALYREGGELRLHSGERLHSRQSYVYAEAAEGFVVRFEDSGDLFEEVRLEPDGKGTLVGTAQHLCADDLYVSKYVFEADGSFTVQHEVNGPRKAYTVRTVYRRL